MNDTDTGHQQNPYMGALLHLRHSFVQAGLLSAAINVLMLAGPLYMLQIYDRVLSSGSLPTLFGLFTIVTVLYVFLGLYEFFRARLLSRAGYKLDGMLSRLTFQQQIQAETDARSDRNSGLRDLEILRGFLSGPAIRSLFDAPWVPIFLITVFLIHPFLGVLTLIGAGIVALLAFANQLVTRQPLAKAAQQDGAERQLQMQSLRNIDTIQAMGMRGAITNRWLNAHTKTLEQSQRAGDRSDGFTAFSRAFRLLLQSLLLTAGAYLALNQQISAGMIVGSSILATRTLAPLDQIIAQWRSIGKAIEAHRRLKTALNGVTHTRTSVALPDPQGYLQLNNVTRLMPGDGQPGRKCILDEVSFALEPGDVLGVIGNSASGKSSLARLLVGIWQPDAGEVRLDGATLDQWNPDALGRHVGYLPQYLDMLPGTIAENISRFAPEPDEDAIFAAARATGMHNMILDLPDGYATRVGIPDQPLSGGQIQRIGLARAIYQRPRLVVLDEPNAHLDSTGEEALTGTIRYLREHGSTVVIMTHRPGIIAQANKILILHKGKLAKFGPREEIFQLALQSAPPAPLGPRKVVG